MESTIYLVEKMELLTNFVDRVIELSKDNPNDADLGGEIRKLIKDNKKG